MASLTNELINQTYDSLIKTIDNLPIDGTHKVLSDGVGTALTMSASTAGINFSGDIDFSAATVTGLPGGTDTTYDFGAVGAAGNINFALSGSDASNDVVTMQAGTNITLTDNGSNTFTIDAAGGGGGGSTKIAYNNGNIITATGPSTADTVIDSVLIPAGTVAPGDKLSWTCPLTDGPEGLFNYVSLLVGPVPGVYEPSEALCLGRQSSGGGADGYLWERTMHIGPDGAIHLIDSNTYEEPTFSSQGVTAFGVDWSVDNYFKVAVYLESASANWTGYVPTLSIYKK